MAVRLIDRDLLLEELTCDFTGNPLHGNRKITIGEVRRIIEGMPTLTPPPRWVSAEERLPEFGQPVIVCRPYDKDTVKVEQGARDINGWWRVYGTRTKRVTHWMPLPEPPGKEMHNET